MIAWFNFIVLVVSITLFVVLYIKSVSPAVLEQRIGTKAYTICGRYRTISIIFMTVALVNYIVYYFYPLPVPLPKTFPWAWWISGLVSGVIAIPSLYLMVRGMIDAGEEALTPRKEHQMFGGIYQKIRHPQAWEALLWFVLAFALHSPFLVLFSFLGLLGEYLMIRAEERDLIIRFGKAYEQYIQHTGVFWPK